MRPSSILRRRPSLTPIISCRLRRWSGPCLRASGSSVLAYNTVLLGSLVGSALAMHLLARRVTGSTVGALAAGTIWGFWPYHTAHLGHLQLQATYAMPLAFLALHRLVAGTRARDALVFGAAAAFHGGDVGLLRRYRRRGPRRVGRAPDDRDRRTSRRAAGEALRAGGGHRRGARGAVRLAVLAGAAARGLRPKSLRSVAPRRDAGQLRQRPRGESPVRIDRRAPYRSRRRVRAVPRLHGPRPRGTRARGRPASRVVAPGALRHRPHRHRRPPVARPGWRPPALRAAASVRLWFPGHSRPRAVRRARRAGPRPARRPRPPRARALGTTSRIEARGRPANREWIPNVDGGMGAGGAAGD